MALRLKTWVYKIKQMSLFYMRSSYGEIVSYKNMWRLKCEIFGNKWKIKSKSNVVMSKIEIKKIYWDTLKWK